MSSSAKYSSQESDSDRNQPLHQDITESQSNGIASERAEHKDVCLVEQILEFLEKYPACFTRPAMTPGYTQSC